MDNWTLPEPARTAWLRTRTLVRKALERLDPGIEYRLGGGSTLAAQWRHRSSFDVDLQIDPDVELHKLERPEFQWFRKAIEKLGGTPEHRTRANMCSIRFGAPPGEREIQIWGHEPEIACGQRGVLVEGRIETVLSNAQILRGKLQRAEQKLARDVYDVAMAATRDPKSLEIAVNGIAPERLDAIALDWMVGYGKIGNNAHERLRGVPKNEEQDYYRLGANGARALVEAQYDHLQVRVKDARIIVEAVTKRGDRRKMTMAASEAEDRFEAYGINGHLRRTRPRARAIREYAMELCGRRADDVLVYEETKNDAIRWRTATESKNLPPLGRFRRPC